MGTVLPSKSYLDIVYGIRLSAKKVYVASAAWDQCLEPCTVLAVLAARSTPVKGPSNVASLPPELIARIQSFIQVSTLCDIEKKQEAKHYSFVTALRACEDGKFDRLDPNLTAQRMREFIKSYDLILNFNLAVADTEDEFDHIAVILPRLSYTRTVKLEHIRGERPSQTIQSFPIHKLGQPTEDEERRFWKLCRDWGLEALQSYSIAEDIHRAFEERMEERENTKSKGKGKKGKGKATKNKEVQEKMIIKPEWMLVHWMEGLDDVYTDREINEALGPMAPLLNLLGGRAMGSMGSLGFNPF